MLVPACRATPTLLGLVLCLLLACRGAGWSADAAAPSSGGAAAPVVQVLPVGSTPGVAATPPVGYLLYPGDLLHIDIFDHPDLSCNLRIPVSGNSTFPLLGNVGSLAGRGLSDFCDELRRRLEADYLRQAVITSTIVEFGPRFVYVLGSVRLPSAVPLPPLRTTTSMQAIAEAGGFAEDANRAASRVIRDNPSGMGKIAMVVPPTDQASALADDINLLPGDVVIVPQLDRIYVVGKVTRPGAISLPSQEVLTVSKAISLAGGFDRFAVQDGVQLVRPGEVRTIDVKGILTGNKIVDPVLQQGDTVYVPEARF